MFGLSRAPVGLVGIAEPDGRIRGCRALPPEYVRFRDSGHLSGLPGGLGALDGYNDQRLLAELNWSIMAMAVAELFALKEQLAKQSGKSRAKKQVADPAKRSLAHAVRALRGCMRDREGIPEPGQELSALLANAVTDSYVRTRAKAARYRPSKPDKKLTGAPKVRKMTAQEKRQAKHRSRNNCRLVNVAITLRGMISNKHWTVISRTMLRARRTL